MARGYEFDIVDTSPPADVSHWQVGDRMKHTGGRDFTGRVKQVNRDLGCLWVEIDSSQRVLLAEVPVSGYFAEKIDER